MTELCAVVHHQVQEHVILYQNIQSTFIIHMPVEQFIVLSFLQIVSGRHAQGTRVLHLLIGVAVASAGLLKEFLKYIDVVKKMLKHFGALTEPGTLIIRNLP